MTETEGVIKFDLTFHEEVLTRPDVGKLSAWRSVMKALGLVGETPLRYDGYGFGNMSQRCDAGFVISGTQTGNLDDVSLSDYAVCDVWDLGRNAVSGRGQVKPSSESLSHAAVYDVSGDINCAFHAHSPDIWHQARRLGIPVTDPEVAYGTPEMAAEVRRLMTGMAMPGIFAMGGHEDGVFTFGSSLDEAGHLMISTLVKARCN